jgi:phosphonate transport system permease protein
MTENGAGPKQIADPLYVGRASVGSLRLIVILVLFLAAHVYGWQVTKINLYDLATGLPNMRHIIVGLLQPELFDRIVETVTAEVPFGLGCPDRAPRNANLTLAGTPAVMSVSPGCATAGEAVTVSGTGFAVGQGGQLFLVDPTGFTRRAPDIEVGPDGKFETAFQAPGGTGEFKLRVQTQTPSGGWKLSDTLSLSLGKVLETLFLALLGTTAGVILTAPLSFLGARNIMHGSPIADAVYYTVRTAFNILRSVEVMILAVIFVTVVGIGPFAGVIAIVIHSIGALGKLYSEAIESIDPGPIEAITATGASRIQVVAYAVVPQVIPAFLSFTMYRWDINVRMSTVIGLVGGGGIGFLLIQYINLLQWNQAATAIWLITIIVMVLDFSSAYLRRKII